MRRYWTGANRVEYGSKDEQMFKIVRFCRNVFIALGVIGYVAFFYFNYGC